MRAKKQFHKSDSISELKGWAQVSAPCYLALYQRAFCTPRTEMPSEAAGEEWNQMEGLDVGSGVHGVERTLCPKMLKFTIVVFGLLF